MRCFLKILAVVSVSVFMTEAVSAQVPDNLPKLKEISSKKQLESVSPQRHKSGLWGYADSEGKFVIRPVFTEACPYEGKVARVNVGGLWGTIGDNGLFIVTPAYSSIDKYSSDSLAVVVSDGRYGLINSKGFKVSEAFYEHIRYADYGYQMTNNGLSGTINKAGKVMLSPRFESIESLDKWRGLEQVRIGDRWGVLKDGNTLLTLAFDDRIELLQTGSSGRLDLYLAEQNNSKGIVTPYGQFVTPCVYDDISPASSGRYYVTRIGDRYGAISLNMSELAPPVLRSIPYIGEDIFKVHHDGEFYAVNHNGAVPFQDCSDLYHVFRPDDYSSTSSIPEWAKHIMVEQNLSDRQTAIQNASLVLDVLKRHNYDVISTEADESLPEGYDLRIPASVTELYGIADGGVFVRESGTVTDYNSGYHNLHFKAMSKSGMTVRLVSVPSSGEYLITVEDEQFSLAPVLQKSGMTEYASLCPKDFAVLSDDSLLVRFCFGGRDAEQNVLVRFSFDGLASVSYDVVNENGDYRLLASLFGGFYTCSTGSVIASHEIPLKRYDRNGIFDWEYRPLYGEKIYAIDETENYIYLCGSTISASSTGTEMPVVIQLNKRGEKVSFVTRDVQNARFTGILCKDFMIYAKTASSDGKNQLTDYYPYFSLEEMGDDFGVALKCVWEPWGDGVIGGCGLVSHDGRWIYSPVLKSDQMCTEYGWEFSAFVSDFLIVRHMGKYGLVNKEGSIVIEPKYDVLEPLENPEYVKASVGDSTGVLSVSGRVVVPLKYDYVGRMNDDMIVVSREGRFGCFDKDGTLAVPLEYDEIREYVDGMARFRYKGKYGFISKNGEIPVAPFSDDVENFSENYTLVTIKNKVGFVNLQGDWLVVPMYDSGGSFSAGYAYLSQAGKYGYINNSGDFAIPMQFSQATDFNPEYGLACVEKSGMWGVIDKSGKIIVPFEYSKVEICSDGSIYVEKNGKCGIFSQYGKVIYPAVCDSIERDAENRIFMYGSASGRIDGQRVRIDRNGNVVYQYAMLSDM